MITGLPGKALRFGRQPADSVFEIGYSGGLRSCTCQVRALLQIPKVVSDFAKLLVVIGGR